VFHVAAYRSARPNFKATTRADNRQGGTPRVFDGRGVFQENAPGATGILPVLVIPGRLLGVEKSLSPRNLRQLQIPAGARPVGELTGGSACTGSVHE
jgi:hypothetical protein